MKIKSFLWGAVILLLIGSSAFAGYFYHSYQSLKVVLDQEITSKAPADPLSAFTDELAKLQKQLSASALSIPDVIPTETPTPEATKISKTPTTLPRISVEPGTIDLKVIRQADGVVKADFTITNTGGSDLKIYSTLSSCGCTTAPLKNKLLKPNESVVLPVQYDPNYFKGAIGQGDIEKQITIFSNDPTNPFYKIFLKMTVAP